MTSEKREKLLMESFSDSTKLFFEWLINCCGLSDKSWDYTYLQLIIKNKEDLDYFIDNFDGDMSISPTVDRLYSLYNVKAG